MQTELLMLGLSVILGFVQILLAAWGPVSVRGLGWAFGARDEAAPPMTSVAGRLARASHNFRETFPFFAAALIACLASGRTSALSVLGAELYFWARLVYVPLYAAGIPFLRTLVWLVSIIGIALILVTLF